MKVQRKHNIESSVYNQFFYPTPDKKHRDKLNEKPRRYMFYKLFVKLYQNVYIIIYITHNTKKVKYENEHSNR